MSQLIEKLNHLGKSPAQTIGFRHTPAPKEAPLLFIARLKPGEPAPEGADALLLEPAPGTPITPPPGGVIWGLRAEAAAGADLARLPEQGCDFVLFTLDAPAQAVAGKMGRLLTVDPELSDSWLRGLGLIADGLVLNLERQPLTLRELVLFHRCAAVSRQPLLAQVSGQLIEAELGPLINAGVKGLIVAADAAKLRQWREAAFSLPAAKEPLTPLVPPPQVTIEREQE